MLEQRAQTPLVEAQSADMARAMSSICNDDQGCLGLMSGHERKPLTLSEQPAFGERDHLVAADDQVIEHTHVDQPQRARERGREVLVGL